MNISESTVDKIQKIGHELLEISSVDEFRNEAINRLSEFYFASTSAFLHWANASGKPEKIRKEDIHFWQMEPKYQDIYFSDILKDDPFNEWHHHHPGLRVTALSAIASPTEVKASALYQEVLGPNKQHDILTILLIVNRRLLGNISLTRHQNAPLFGAKDIQLALLFAPILSAAYSKVLMHQRVIDHKNIIDILASQYADRFCMILNGSGELIYTNGSPSTGVDDHPLPCSQILESLKTDISVLKPATAGQPSILRQAQCRNMGFIHYSSEDQYGWAKKHALRHHVINHDSGLFHILSLDSNLSSSPATELTNRYGLTKREVEIINKVKLGLNSTEIGEELFISRWTVKNHLQSIYNKVGVNNRVSLVELLH